MITNKVSPGIEVGLAAMADDTSGLNPQTFETVDVDKASTAEDAGLPSHDMGSTQVRVNFSDESSKRNVSPSGPKPNQERLNNIKLLVQESISLFGVPRAKSEMCEHNEQQADTNFLKKRIRTMLQPTDNRLSMKLFGSQKGIKMEKKRLQAIGSLVIHPCSNLRVYWDFLMIAILIINLITIPVSITFFKQEEIGLQWIVINCVSDTLFITDIFFNFRTGILNHDGNELVILDPKKIAKHYLKSWFFLDLVSSLPMDYIILLMGGGNESIYKASRALRFLRMAKLLSLLRLLRLSRLVRFIRHWEQTFNIAGAVIRIFNLVCMMVLISHWNGCLQFLVPKLQDYPAKSWVTINNLENAAWVDQYTWSLFKAMSHMLCIGYGRFPPQSMSDVWLTIISMISGATCFALFIGHATTIIQSMDSSSRQYREKVKQVEEYMANRKLSKELREKITDYYEYRYHGKMFDEEVIFEEVSQVLKETIANYNCRSLVSSVPFFMNADPNFVTKVVTHLKYEVFQPGDYIVREGTFGESMFFIQQGVVDVLTQEGQVATSLSDGSYFGEICLLTRERRVASIRAETYCSLFSLSVENFQSVVREYPSIRKTMEEIAIRRLKKIGRSASLIRKNTNSSSKKVSVLFQVPSDADYFSENEEDEEEQVISVTEAMIINETV
ncbi:potassium/sodium hyperpolarization-activated cyclic nucleotide-gated channel 2-like [Antedon mediterranea]|uniref:potassium/sodium hyperpolarization-activated cyclic nucleotide-gated channel 2-like n=1 Tax=Antedon mediterranea TaxID=105859 RepID=UPI003AF865BD